MNEIVNKLLLVGDKLIPEMHLRHPVSLNKSEFTYSACGRFTTKKERIKKFKKKQKQKTIQTISVKMNQIRSVLRMIWLMENLKI